MSAESRDFSEMAAFYTLEANTLRDRIAQLEAQVERAYAAGVCFTATSTDQMAEGLRKWDDYKATIGVA